jgi:hypothetical protein
MNKQNKKEAEKARQIEEAKQANFAWVLAQYERNFKKENNFLFAWQALKACFEFDVPVPQWVKQYFLLASTEVLLIAKEREPGDKQKTAVWIQDALSLNPGTGRKMFKNYRRHFRNLLIYDKVDKEKTGSITDKSVKVSRKLKRNYDDPQYHIESDTVERIYYTVRKEKIAEEQEMQKYLTERLGMVIK